MFSKIRNVFLVFVLVAVVGVVGHLDAVDQPGRWVARRLRLLSLGMRGVVTIPVPSLPRSRGRIFRLVSSRMVPSRSMVVPPISMCACGMRPCRAMVTAARMCLSMAARFWSGEEVSA